MIFDIASLLLCIFRSSVLFFVIPCLYPLSCTYIFICYSQLEASHLACIFLAVGTMIERAFPPLRRRSITHPMLPLIPLKVDCLLPEPGHHQPRIRVRTILGHCLYRRVIIWSLTLLSLLLLTMYTSGRVDRTTPSVLLEEIRNSQYWGGLVGLRPQGEALGTTVNTTQGHEDEVRLGGDERINETEHPPHWLKYRHLDGYFYGLKALVPYTQYIPDFPRNPDEESPYPLTVTYNGMPTPTPYVPHPDYKSSEYIAAYSEVKTCYLDPDNKIPAPDLYVYNGVIQGQPKPAIGSHSIFGIPDDICWDRFGRYGPYGMGYSYDEGGVFEGMDTEKAGSDTVWSKTGKIDYNLVDWAEAQERCLERNRRRFTAPDEDQSLSTVSSYYDEESDDNVAPRYQTRFQRNSNQQKFTKSKQHHAKIDRTAVVIRTYVGFQWTQHAILNFRAMISELSIRSGGEYAVHFLLHVHDDSVPIWADAETAQHVLDDNVPPEFHGLCTLWSEAQMKLLYPGDFGETVENPSQQDIHGVYRSAHMPLQHFALTHPQYAHFWNWEMDMRWLGNYYELFDRLGVWARNQSRTELWERNQKYYIPHLHGDWEEFTRLVHEETMASGRRPVMGPVHFAGREGVRFEEQGRTFLPSSCTGPGADLAWCGVGEEADLITLNPLFIAEDSGWVFASDVTGYNPIFDTPPRRCAIITASRLSRRLLAVMHEETWRMKHSMFSEMFPATMALHHGLKAVYAPHPVFIDREWDMDVLDESFNGGRDRSTSGHGSPFDVVNEHNHKGTSWYFNSEFSGLLWRRWLGFAQWDGRGADGKGTLRGGREEESRRESTGILCLRSMLVHPVKWEHPDEGPQF